MPRIRLDINDKSIMEITDRLLGSDSDPGDPYNFAPEVIKEYMLTNVRYIDFDTESEPPTHQEGRMHWNSEDGTIELGMPGGTVILQMGEELLVKVTNKTGSTIYNGTPVYVNGAQGSRPTIAPAQANNAMTSLTVAGMTTEDIENNMSGYITNLGVVRDIDTSLFDAGDILYLSADNPGELVTTPPSAPNFVVGFGVVLFSSAEDGMVLVRTKVYPNLNRIADVSVSSATANQILLYDFVGGYWYNSDPKFGDPYGEANYTEFESNGTMVAKGSAICWEDIVLSVTSLGIGASAPDLVEINSSGIYTYAFDGLSTSEQLFGCFEVPHNYAEGTDLSPHIHWMPTTADAGDVKWCVQFYRVGTGDTFSTTPGEICAVESTNETAWEAFTTASEIIDGSDISIAEQIAFRLYRDPSDAEDTYAHDAAVLTFGIHYQIDTLGSREIYTK